MGANCFSEKKPRETKINKNSNQIELNKSDNNFKPNNNESIQEVPELQLNTQSQAVNLQFSVKELKSTKNFENLKDTIGERLETIIDHPNILPNYSKDNEKNELEFDWINKINQLQDLEEGSNFNQNLILQNKRHKYKYLKLAKIGINLTEVTDSESIKNINSNTDNDGIGDQRDFSFIKLSFDNFFITKNFPKVHKYILFSKLKFYKFENEVVFAENMIGNYFYIILEGCFYLYKKNVLIKTIEEGKVYEINSLAYSQKREFTAICYEPTSVLMMSRQDFVSIIWNITKVSYTSTLNLLHNSYIFSISDCSKNTIISCYISSIIHFCGFKPFIAQEIINQLDTTGTTYIDKQDKQLFEYLSLEKKRYLVDPTKSINISPAIYIIISGQVLLETSDTEDFFFDKTILNLDEEQIKGTKCSFSFGEDTIILKQNFNYKVKAIEDIKVLKIYPELLKCFFGEKYLNYLFYSVLKKLFSEDQELRFIPEELIYKAFTSSNKIFFFKRFSSKNIILKSDHIGNEIIVCLTGYLYSSKTNEIILKPLKLLFAQYFVKEYILSPDEDILSSDYCELIICNYSDLQKTIYSNNKNISNRKNFANLASSLYNYSNYFNILSFDKLLIISEKFEKKSYKKDDVIVYENDILDKFYLVKFGSICINKNLTSSQHLDVKSHCNIRRSNKYQARSSYKMINKNREALVIYEKEGFGFKNLLISEKSIINITCLEDTEVYIINSFDFKKFITPSLLEYFTQIVSIQDDNIKLSEIYYLDKIGDWDYGEIFLTQNIRTNIYYNIRQYKRNLINSKICMKSLDQTKKIIKNLTHPFAVKFISFLKDDNNIFLINESISGISLKDLVFEKSLNINHIQFYVACITIFLEFIHKKSIICRKVNQNSIVINEKGFPKLIDFSNVKEVKDKTSTILGECHFNCPEMILGEGYSCWSDVWALGILTYYLSTKKYPFGNNSNNPIEIFQSILDQ